MNQPKGQKKVVKVEAPASTGEGRKGRVWAPSQEAKTRATTFRLFAWIGWILAIAIEIYTIVAILPQAAERFWLLLVMLLPMAVLAFGASMLWKKANRLDPASRANGARFFIQNQLGAIMTVIAFLPLIVLVLLDKNMDGKQKGIAGGLAAVAMVAIGLYAAEFDGGPSQEQYAYEENVIERLTGEDRVFWVKGGSVFHVCAAVPDVNKESADGTIYDGSVAAAHAAGKDRLTKRWASEAINHCGYTQEDVDAVTAGLAVDFPDEADEEPAPTGGDDGEEGADPGDEAPDPGDEGEE